MYAIVRTGGKQYKVKSGDLIEIEKIDAKVGDQVNLEEVLAVGEEGGTLTAGTPLVSGAAVSCEVVDQFRAKKVWAFKMKRRKGYRRTVGHRQSLTRVKVVGIQS